MYSYLCFCFVFFFLPCQQICLHLVSISLRDWGRRGCDRMVVGFTNTCAISAYHNYSIKHYVIKFVSDLQLVGGFLRVLRFPPPIKLTPRYSWNIVESDVKHHKPNHNQLRDRFGNHVAYGIFESVHLRLLWNRKCSYCW